MNKIDNKNIKYIQNIRQMIVKMICKFAQFSGQLYTGFCAKTCYRLEQKEHNKHELIPNYPINVN